MAGIEVVLHTAAHPGPRRQLALVLAVWVIWAIGPMPSAIGQFFDPPRPRSQPSGIARCRESEDQTSRGMPRPQGRSQGGTMVTRSALQQDAE